MMLSPFTAPLDQTKNCAYSQIIAAAAHMQPVEVQPGPLRRCGMLAVGPRSASCGFVFCSSHSKNLEDARCGGEGQALARSCKEAARSSSGWAAWGQRGL